MPTAPVQLRVVQKIVDRTVMSLVKTMQRVFAEKTNARTIQTAPQQAQVNQDVDIVAAAPGAAGLRQQCWDFQLLPNLGHKVVNETILVVDHE